MLVWWPHRGIRWTAEHATPSVNGCTFLVAMLRQYVLARQLRRLVFWQFLQMIESHKSHTECFRWTQSGVGAISTNNKFMKSKNVVR